MASVIPRRGEILAGFMGPHLADCPSDREPHCSCTREPPIVFFYEAADGSGLVPWSPHYDAQLGAT